MTDGGFSADVDTESYPNRRKRECAEVAEPPVRDGVGVAESAEGCSVKNLCSAHDMPC